MDHFMDKKHNQRFSAAKIVMLCNIRTISVVWKSPKKLMFIYINYSLMIYLKFICNCKFKIYTRY